MPELPDLFHVERKLRAAVVDHRIIDAHTGDPTVLRLMVSDPFPQLLVDRHFRTIDRRGHFICFGLDGNLSIAINCMLTGRFQLSGRDGRRAPKSLALGLALDGDLELRYVDEKRMGKVYVCPSDRLGEIPVLSTLGVDILADGFTLQHFRKLAKTRRDQVRQFLMDKSAIASIGNAYADEILFVARIHPKTFVRKLDAAEIDRLYDAILSVTRQAIDEITGRDPPIDAKVRDFLAVRGRVGEPCPVCGTKLRAVRVGDGDANFCPVCQPATRSLFVDWSKLPKKPPDEA